MSFTFTCWMSNSNSPSNGDWRSHSVVATVRRLDKELRFFDKKARFFRMAGRLNIAMRREEVMRELAPREGIEEFLRFVKSCSEFLDNLLRVVRNARQFRRDQGFRGLEHGLITHLPCPVIVSGFQSQLGFKYLPLGGRQAEIHRGNNFPGALADSHIPQTVFPRIVPVPEEPAVALLRRWSRQVFEKVFDLRFANSLDKIPEALAFFAGGQVAVSEPRHNVRNVFGLNRHHGHAIGSRVGFPIDSQT